MKKILYPNKNVISKSHTQKEANAQSDVNVQNDANAQNDSVNAFEKIENETETQTPTLYQPNFQNNEIKLSQYQKYSQEQESEAEVKAISKANLQSNAEAEANTEANSTEIEDNEIDL